MLGAYLFLLPRASVLTVFFFVFIFFLREIPAWIFLGVWILFQAWSGGIELVHPNAGGGVAFFAHIGGFASASWRCGCSWCDDRCMPAY